MKRPWRELLPGRRDLAALALLATVYTVTARVGLGLDAVSNFATLVWPPTGIALAVLIHYGGQLWPAVFVGAFVANYSIGAPAPVALGIAVGNTLEAVVGAYALRRIPGFRPWLEQVRDVLGLIVFGALLSTTLSATFGVGSLYLGGLIAAEAVGRTWTAWWLGDLSADLVFAPMLLTWMRRPVPSVHRTKGLEAAVLAGYFAVTAALVFGLRGRFDSGRIGAAYLFFPPLVWATLRFGQRGAVGATFMTTMIAVAATTLGFGPFVNVTLAEGLFVLQAFIGATAASFLMLGALASERNQAIAGLEASHRTLELRVEERTASLRAANERFQGLFESAPDGMVIIHEDGRIALVNAQAVALFGYEREELIGQPIEVLVPERFRTVHVAHRAGYTREPRVRLMGVGLELFARRKDGSAVPVEISLSPIASDQGTLICSAIRDITDRKHIERELQRARDELEERVAERTRELDRLTEQLAEAVRARDAFISVASHELRSPLAALQINIDQLKRSHPDLPNREMLSRQVRRLGVLVNNLLDVARITAGRVVVELEDVELVVVVQEVVQRFSDDSRRARSPIAIRSPGPVVGRWDPLRLDQIVTNLVSNAIKYGGSRPIELEILGDPDVAVLRVRDHGPGISPEDQARLFEPFERLVTGKHVGGMGLGLWIVRQLTEALGGTVRVDSELGRGSTFTVELPRFEGAWRAAPPSTH